MVSDQLTRGSIRLLEWALAHPDVASATAAVLVGAIGSTRHYRRTGSVPLATLPWRALRRLGYALRRRFFSAPKPSKQPFIVDGTLEAVREELATNSFVPRWPLSWRYHGEDLNARRYFYDEARRFPHRQIHVRGWVVDDGSVELLAHEEPDPLHHPRAHLRSEDMRDATRWLEDAWKRPDLDPRSFEDDHAP